MRKLKPIQINIPTPCQQEWSNMLPNEQGRFCNNCQKTVVDFTRYTDSAIYDYMQSHENQRICGRFYATQLSYTIQVPPQPHSKLYRYFIGLGLTLLFTHLPQQHLMAKTPFLHRYDAASKKKHKPTDLIEVRINGWKNDNPLPGSFIIVSKNNKLFSTGYTDQEGKFYFKKDGYAVYTIAVNAQTYPDFIQLYNIDERFENNINIILNVNRIPLEEYERCVITGDTIIDTPKPVAIPGIGKYKQRK